MSGINIHDFVTVFDATVRAWLDWSRVLTECTVDESFSDSRAELGELFTVWYAGPRGQHAGYDGPGARPLRVGETSLTEATWPTERATKIETMSASHAGSAREPVVLPLPAYRVGAGAVILDGTHRAVAAYRARAEVRLMLFILDGPTDPEILPDLRHH